MKTVYLITEGVDTGESYEVIPLEVWDDSAAAEERRGELEQAHDAKVKAYEQVQRENKKWQDANPRPPLHRNTSGNLMGEWIQKNYDNLQVEAKKHGYEWGELLVASQGKTYEVDPMELRSK